MRNVLHLLQPECAKRNVVPALTADGPAWVMAEPVALDQIVHNLLLNALQALDQVPANQRTLRIGVLADPLHGVLTVSDSGQSGRPRRDLHPHATRRKTHVKLHLPPSQTALPMNAPLSPLIHLIDDDAAVWDALSLLISTVGLRVQAWAEPQTFMADFDRESIGAIVLDVRMPGISGLSVLDTLMAQGVDQPILMLTGHGTVEMCRRDFKSGPAEFLEKPVNDETLIEALQNAVRQHVKLRQRHRADQDARKRFEQLSGREREVLGLIVGGLTNKEIGRALTLSPRTVETHRANLFAKLETASLAQLIRQYAALADEDAET